MRQFCIASMLFFISASVFAEPIWLGTGKFNDDAMLGTIHVGDERTASLSARVKSLINKADVIAVEVDLSNVSPWQQQQALTKLAMLSEAQSLSDLLKPSTVQHVQAYLHQYGSDISHYQRFKPWMLAIVMVQQAYQKMGLNSQTGIDQQVVAYAKLHNKKIIELETFEQQLNIFNRLFEQNPDVSYDDMLMDTLNELEQMSTLPNEMLNAWLKGDLNVFQKIYKKTLADTDYDQALEQILLVERNRAWQNRLEPLFAKHAVLVATGTLHYIGENGLPSLFNNEFKFIKN